MIGINLMENKLTDQQPVVKTSLDSMKTELVELITQAKAAGHSCEETPTLFKWVYEEHPDIQVQMLIKGIPKEEEPKEQSRIILHS